MVVDIGGGSTEIIVADKSEPEDVLTEGDVVEAKVVVDGQGRRRATQVRRRRTAL